MRRLDLKRSLYKIFIVLIVVGFLFAVLERVGAMDPIKGPVQQVTIPIQIGLFQVRNNISNFFQTLTEVGDLRNNNLQLEEENALLKAENQKLKELSKENQALREQIGASIEGKQGLLVAKTIGFSPIVSKKLLIIDKGKLEGVEKGMVAVVRNIFIGRIYEVSPHSSSIQLVSDPDTKIAAITDKNIRGIVSGQFGAEIELREVVQGKSLNPGDLVFTIGGSDIPRGLVIGEIKEVKKVERELFQRATVKPLIEQDKLSNIFILIDK